jgi:hypothetical protein
VLLWIRFGLLAGISAKWLTSGSDQKGCILIIGIVEAAVGSRVDRQFVPSYVCGFEAEKPCSGHSPFRFATCGPAAVTPRVMTKHAK